MSRAHYTGIAAHYTRLAVLNGGKQLDNFEIERSPALYESALSTLAELPDEARQLLEKVYTGAEECRKPHTSKVYALLDRTYRNFAKRAGLI